MATLGYSYIPVHPGEIVKEELQARNIPQKKIAELLGISYTMLNEILNGKRPVTTDIALLFEASTGINAELLVNMQSRYNLQVARTDKRNETRLENIRKICASLF